MPDVIELREPIEVVTPLGLGWALFLHADIHDQWYTVVLDSGALVTIQQKKLRVKRNYSYGRRFTDAQMEPIANPPTTP